MLPLCHHLEMSLSTLPSTVDNNKLETEVQCILSRKINRNLEKPIPGAGIQSLHSFHINQVVPVQNVAQVLTRAALGLCLHYPKPPHLSSMEKCVDFFTFVPYQERELQPHGIFGILFRFYFSESWFMQSDITPLSALSSYRKQCISKWLMEREQSTAQPTPRLLKSFNEPPVAANGESAACYFSIRWKGIEVQCKRLDSMSPFATVICGFKRKNCEVLCLSLICLSAGNVI